MSRPSVGDTLRIPKAVGDFPAGTVFKVVKSRPIRAVHWCYGEGYPDDEPWGTLDTDIEAWERMTQGAERLAQGRGL